MKTGGGSITQFHFGVVIVPQLAIGLGAMSDLSPESLQTGR